MHWLTSYAEDLLIIAGLGVIVWASFLVATVLGLYILGAVLVGFGVLLARIPAGRRR